MENSEVPISVELDEVPICSYTDNQISRSDDKVEYCKIHLWIGSRVQISVIEVILYSSGENNTSTM